MLASAWEAGITPVGTCVADNNPHLLDAIVACQSGRNDKIMQGSGSGNDDALREETERNRKLADNVVEIQSAGGQVPKAVGRRRRRR